jgi:D-threonate/D-erythronate kinase
VPTDDTLFLRQVIVIADDLTGACDTAVAFSTQGLRTTMMVDGRAEDASAEVIAVNTESRELPAQEARRKLTTLAGQLNLKRFPYIFKKIDSVFRGNTFAEIKAVVEEFPFELAIMAPAYPKLGRTSKDGVVKVLDLSGERTLDVLRSLHAEGLGICHIKAGSRTEEIAEVLEKNLRGECHLVYCDAISESDLQSIVTESRKLAVRTLWIGSAGLAHALAIDMATDNSGRPSFETLTDSPLETSGSVVFFIGSDHLVTQKQVAALREKYEVAEPSFQGFKRSRSKGGNTFIMPVIREVTTELDISRTLESIHPDEISCLFMTGGDTAALVCRALGVQTLQMLNEFAPGLPRGLVTNGTLNGATVILKSGGFGEIDVLCRIAETYQPKLKTRDEVAH